MTLVFEDFSQRDQQFPRTSIVESPFALFQVQMEVLFGHAVELPHVPLCLVPEVLDTVDVTAFAVGNGLLMIDADMVISDNIEAVVAAEGIAVDNAVEQYFLLDDGHECLGFGIGNHLRVNLPSALQDAEYRNLACSAPAAFAFPPAAEVALIHFHFTVEGQLLFLIGGNPLTHLPEECCGRMPVHTGKICCRSCRDSCDKELEQFIRLFR